MLNPSPNPTPAEPKKVGAETILGLFPKKAVMGLTAIQQAGMRIASGVGCISVVVMIVIGWVWITSTPPTPQLLDRIPVGDTTYLDNTKQLIDQYKILSEVARSGPSTFFDQIVVKVLYPLFTLVLGYIFGVKKTEDVDGDG